MAKAKKELSLEEKLEQALVPVNEQPYEVPENWYFFRFTSLIDIEGGTQPPKSQFVDEPLEGYVRLVQIRDFGSDKYIVYVPDTKKLRKFNKNDIMIARYGASIGRICRGLEGAYNVALAKTIFSEKILNREYVYWMLQSETFQNPLTSISRSAQAGFNKEDLYEFRMPLPPLAEQKRIVEQIESLFGKLDEVTEKVNDCLEFSIKRKASIMNKAFNGELTAEWRKKKGLDFEEWKTLRLDQLCKKITDGTHHSPPNTDRGEYMYVTAKNIKVTGVDLTNITYVSKAVHDEIYSRCDVRMNDVLYIKDGATTGVATINTIEKPFSLLSSVAVLRVNKELLVPEYLCFLLNSEKVKGMMISNMSGNAITRLTLTKIKQTELPICSLSEQNEIVKILKNISKKEEELELVCKYLTAKVNMMKKSILARAFRGKLGTNNPDEESAVELLKSILVSE